MYVDVDVWVYVHVHVSVSVYVYVYASVCVGVCLWSWNMILHSMHAEDLSGLAHCSRRFGCYEMCTYVNAYVCTLQ